MFGVIVIENNQNYKIPTNFVGFSSFLSFSRENLKKIKKLRQEIVS